MSDDLFFVSRNGAIWACWLSGKPAIKLGDDDEVVAAMAQFLRPAKAPQPAAVPPPASATHASSPAGLPPSPAPHLSSLAPPPRSPAQVAKRVLKDRAAARHDLTILGRIFTANGSRDVTILDLSESGCQFHAPMSHLKIDERLTVKLGPVGPVEATVRWHRGDKLGVQFNSPLYPSVLDHIRDHFDLRRR